jgi:predicted regulator of Ras-like GTPase activity (Roadblock/LC7/MglB family)
MFRDSLQKMVDRLAGGVAGILMGFDGISVDAYTKPGEQAIDIQTVGMELAHVVSQMRKAAEQLGGGPLREVTLKADKLIVLVDLINDEYFVACAITPEASFGKARYLMRLLAPQIQADL